MPVFFKIGGDWTRWGPGDWAPADGRAGYQKGARSPAFFIFAFVVFMLTMCAGVPVAIRNLRLGRGDRKGAFRIALYIFITQMMSWALQAGHVPMEAECDRLYAALGWALFYASQLWIIYIALESYMRSNWPHRIIGWSRFLAGNRRDPMVGRDVLVGALFGTVSALLVSLIYFFKFYLRIPPNVPRSVGMDSLLGVYGVLDRLLAMQREVIGDSMYIMVVLLLMLSILRNKWLTFGAAWLAFSVGAGMLVGAQSPIDWVVAGIGVAGYILVLARFGLLAAIAFQFYNFLLTNFPLPLSSADAGGAIVLLVALVLALYACRISIGGQKIFRAGLLTDLHL
jgi:serine/threonine-protein kinase